MGRRSRRARGSSLPRSRKGSVAKKGTQILPKESPFAGRFPRWVSAGTTKREVLQTSRRVEPVTRVPEASKRRVRANRSKNARPPSLRRLGPRFASSTQVERNVLESRCVRAVARRSPVRRRTVGGQRNRHRLVPASSGSKGSLASEGRSLEGCARASMTKVAEIGKRRRGSGKARHPLATGRVDGSLARSYIPGDDGRVKRSREPEARWPSRAAGKVRSRTLERALRGEGP
jgi:hypothetical protein